ncbi:TIGR03915 family putative DNA repair protein [Agarilytica rhodophyticola]|uniref:TIGR03915 family putative DNA repair protein n=1 Tax=Agarilytica rhodophyticola TaxID=1737490 RepID=UPI000B342407|nr:TIGR03915 family putative DNA repair protein [Agarilytica rhodophyticola]
MFSVEVDSLDSWRKQARELLKRDIKPDDVSWELTEQGSLFWGTEEDSFLALPIIQEQLNIPKHFFQLAEQVACYRDNKKWALLYSVAWRLLFERKDLLLMLTDPQVAELLKMQRIIRRDKHKMEAFVRFKQVKQQEDYYIAWFEPEHLIIPAKMPFFIKRFNNMHWSILSPDICAHWDKEELIFTEGVVSPPKIEDELESLWLEYYKNIFNPARLKLKAMQSEMPKKYWKNLPEAQLISELTRNAQTQMDKMVEDGYSSPWKKTSQSHYIKSKQEDMRKFHKESHLIINNSE